MATKKEKEEIIEKEIQKFHKGSLNQSCSALLNALGYKSNKTLKLSPSNYEGFSEVFDLRKNNFNKEKACTDDWEEIEIIFQISNEEIFEKGSLKSSKISHKIIESYIFIGIRLKGSNYKRSQLANITREVNKLASMPIIIFFTYDTVLTISIIDRRLNKRDSSKDVLDRVTLIKDIDILTPHRAHIDILYELDLDRIKDVYVIHSFIDLHEAWRKILDISILNQKFYKEIANWYFWAIKKVKFPLNNKLSDDSSNNSINVIRLLTRLIFVWFLKEKNLVPGKLFNENDLNKIIDFSVDKNKSAYFKAILQNLFFATLNTEMNRDRSNNRRFVQDETKFQKERKEYGIKTLFRYSNLFRISPKDVIILFDDIPFLNGGLFDCLDKEDDSGKVIYIDGFTRNEKLQPVVPDYLFFGSYKHIDLSEDYGDEKRNDENVNGIIDILRSYKFTVTENTPIEEEVALDPELLGNVFENLLASYNPETKSTARKQTGSFYTPREIVNYMVDESIVHYLKNKLVNETDSFLKLGMFQTDMFGNTYRKGQLPLEENLFSKNWLGKEDKLEEEIKNLLAYTDKAHSFNDLEIEILITAIENLKVLDPSCGSGAFPMGVLHKLVHILHKLDIHNRKWKEKQIKAVEAIPDPIIKEQQLNKIEESFNIENNYSDYGRKLYLIQRCIYGVDIQPIAVQISKLRFFISLLVDQKDNPNKANRGVLSLPNLETKFVSANTLIALNKEFGTLFESTLASMREEYGKLKNQLFSADTRLKKKKILDKISALKVKIKHYLKNNLKLKNEALKLKINESLNKIKLYEKELVRINNEFRKSENDLKTNYKVYERVTELKTNKENIIIKAIDTENKNIKRYEESRDNYSALSNNIEEIVNWDFMDQNSSASFYDSEWMFNIKEGFDIVIGNPPYLEARHSAFNEELKELILQSIRSRWSINLKYFSNGSDLLVYFYEVSLYNIKENGIVCFITQNSWLNTDYGSRFQQFLLQNTNIKFIADSNFKHFNSHGGPNINTIISLFYGRKPLSGNSLEFLKYFDSFEKIGQKNSFSNADPIVKELKWGILLNLDSILLNLLRILTERGHKVNDLNMTIGQGLNLSKEYFTDYSTAKEFGIPKKAFIPIFSSDDGAPYILNETKKCLIDATLFNKKEIKQLQKAGIYTFNPTDTKRKTPILILPRGIGRHFCCANEINAYSTSFVELYPNTEDVKQEQIGNVWLFLNSSIAWLVREISGRKNLGGGMLKAEATDLKSFPLYFNFNCVDRIKKIYNKTKGVEAKSSLLEIESDIHKEIDDLVFNYLQIPEGDKINIVEHLKEIILQRTNKSKS